MADKAPFPYAGGKQTIADQIVRLLPAHEHYVEPYAGGLSVLLAKAPSLMETVNDLDSRIVTFWRVLRDRPAELERLCALTPHSREEFLACRDGDVTADDDLHQAWALWVVLTQGRGGQPSGESGWRTVKAPSKSMAFARYIDGYVARMPAAAKRLRGVSLEHRPALDVIQDYNLPATLFYLDPPYPQTVRYGNNNLYKDELMGEKDHRELLDRITDPSMVASVAISSYHSTLYDKALSGWACHEMKSRSAAGNDRTEVLWLNHETPNLLTFPAG